MTNRPLIRMALAAGERREDVVKGIILSSIDRGRRLSIPEAVAMVEQELDRLRRELAA